MKSLTILIITIILLANTNLAKAQVEVSSDVTFSVFYENLMDYGRWVDNPEYGQVWIPDEEGFVPYRTNGHWAYTDDGWTWVSDYDWGWAPFHYGRWDYDDNYGSYYWVPGYEWGPAWVSWRRNEDVYGWAPLSPNMNIGIGISFGREIPVNRWTFVHPRYIAQPQISRYYVDNRRNVTYINNTTIINNVHRNNYNTIIVGGPKRSEAERYTHSRINTYTVNNSSGPNDNNVNRNTINFYRPVVNKTKVLDRTVISNNQKNVELRNRTRNNDNQKGNFNQGANRREPNNIRDYQSPVGPNQRAGTNPTQTVPVTPQGNQQHPPINRSQQQPAQQWQQRNQQTQRTEQQQHTQQPQQATQQQTEQQPAHQWQQRNQQTQRTDQQPRTQQPQRTEQQQQPAQQRQPVQQTQQPQRTEQQQQQQRTQQQPAQQRQPVQQTQQPQRTEQQQPTQQRLPVQQTQQPQRTEQQPRTQQQPQQQRTQQQPQPQRTEQQPRTQQQPQQQRTQQQPQPQRTEQQPRTQKQPETKPTPQAKTPDEEKKQ